MSTEVPFDPQPRPDEVEAVVRRVHRRRAVRAGGSGAAVLAVVAAAVVTLGGSGTQVLLQDEDPPPPAVQPTATASAAAPAAVRSAAPVAGAPASARPAPLLSAGPSPSPRPDAQTSPTPSPEPPAERPVYAGQIGPGYSRFEATDCVVTNRSSSDAVIRNDYCIYFIGAGSKDVWKPRIRICRVYDSTTPGRLTFPGGEEADFALYRGSSSPDGPVVRELLFRFSDTVRYADGAHGRDVAPGDCWTWSLTLPVDFEAYPADAGFVGEWRTRSEQLPARDRVQRTAFTAGDFHGDNAP